MLEIIFDSEKDLTIDTQLLGLIGTTIWIRIWNHNLVAEQIQKNETGYLMKYKASWKVFQSSLKTWQNKWVLSEIKK